MPVLVAPARLAAWLGGPPPAAGADEVLERMGAAALAGRPVSRKVNAAGVDDPGCLGPQETDPQGKLF
jgi:hypothetical protein